MFPIGKLKSSGAAPSPPAASAPEAVELLDGGAQSYPRMLAAIELARTRIHLQVYAFAPSGIGARFVAALGDAARRGVAVEVTVDGWGSARGGRAVVHALRAAGCDARIHNRLRTMLIGRLTRNHRKVLLVDDEVAFVGGINIGDENLGAPGRVGWADLALEIRGPQCAALGHRIRREPHPPVVSAVRIHLSSLGGGWRLRRTYMRAFAGASRRIRIAHGYFLPDAKMIRALVAAARRGVEVRLLLAGHSDVPFARAATRSLYRRLLPAGVRIHEWTDSVLHAKLATIDGRCLLAGSFNLDPLSLANLETLVEVDDPRTVAEGDAWIQRRLATSTIMTSVASGTWVRRWILDPLGRIAARVASATGRLLSTRRARGAVPNPPRAAIEPNADDG